MRFDGVKSVALRAQGRDVQRNLVSILLVTSRSWGLLPTTHESRRLVPRSLLRQPQPLRNSPRVTHSSDHGLRWAW